MLPEPAAAPSPTDASASDAALRDAERIADRVRRDEAAADEAREAYRSEGLPVLDDLPEHLEPGEQLHAVHRLALMEIEGSPTPHGGTLLVTSRRLIHEGADVADWPLSALVEMSVALERLLLLQLTDGTVLAIEVEAPRLLRVQLAAAIAALRDAEAQESEPSEEASA